MYADIRRYLSDEDAERIDSEGLLDEQTEFTEDMPDVDFTLIGYAGESFNASLQAATEFNVAYYAPTPKGPQTRSLRRRLQQKWSGK